MARGGIFLGVNRVSVLDSLRTTLAAVAAMLLARLLKLPEYYWAPISAIVVVQSTIPPRELAWQRFVGTALGALLGAALARSSLRTQWSMPREFFCAACWRGYCAWAALTGLPELL